MDHNSGASRGNNVCPVDDQRTSAMERQVLRAFRLASTASSLPIHLLSSCETGQQLWRRFRRRHCYCGPRDPRHRRRKMRVWTSCCLRLPHLAQSHHESLLSHKQVWFGLLRQWKPSLGSFVSLNQSLLGSAQCVGAVQ